MEAVEAPAGPHQREWNRARGADTVSREIAARLAQSIILLLLVSVAVFVLLRLTPGDPGMLMYGIQASPEDLSQLRQRWGLDEPIHLQYLKWLANAVRGDLGWSYVDGRAVTQVVLERVPATLLLTVSALLFSTVAGSALGILAALRRRTRIDEACGLVATLCYSSPSFWLGLLAVLVFSVSLGWLPSGGMRSPGQEASAPDLAAHLVLPAVILGIREAGRIGRVVRTSLVAAAEQDYARTAIAKGLGPLAVMCRHLLRNALLPLISLIGVAIPGLLSGAVVVETVFGWPGLGRLAIQAALQRDYPVLMGEVVIVACLALLGSLLADIATVAADPRIGRVERERTVG